MELDTYTWQPAVKLKIGIVEEINDEKDVKIKLMIRPAPAGHDEYDEEEDTEPVIEDTDMEVEESIVIKAADLVNGDYRVLHPFIT